MNKLILFNKWEEEYLPYLKPYFGGHTTFHVSKQLTTLTELELYCKKNSINGVVCNQKDILIKLLALRGNEKSTVSLENYAGSFFQYRGIDIVFIDNFKKLFTVKYGKFLTSHLISKITNPGKWRRPSKFVWEVGTESNLQDYYELFETAFLIAIDIETFKDPLAIRCIGFTAIFIAADRSITSRSIVIPLTDSFLLAWARKFCLLPPPKVMQNGKYDSSYCLRFGIIIYNWIFDTANLFHCIFSELPKDLAFLNAFALWDVVYWKDLSETSDLHQYYEYNCRDHWATANACISLIEMMEPYAIRNYVLEFPLVSACLYSEMQGLKRHEQRILEENQKQEKFIETEKASLAKMVGAPINPNSPPQVKKLLIVLGCKDIAEDSSNEAHLNKASFRHPLIKRILDKILSIRGSIKLNSTYLGIGEKSKDFCGFLLSALNPHATDTSRLASREHHFWCGQNIQNIPIRDGPAVRNTIVAIEEFVLGESDLSKAESWDSAYITGDRALKEAVASSNDFHSINASRFFGKAYEVIFDNLTRKPRDKKLRDLSKRTNHGATYNMGPDVLVDTMGLESIETARSLLKLDWQWTPRQIAQYLLAAFHRTYPSIQQKYYPAIIKEVDFTKRITSRAYHHTAYNAKYYPDVKKYIEEGDWTRRTFGNPGKNKLDLNAYCAHPPQSLNARTLNEAYLDIFINVALPNAEDFRFNAQIHDSILFQFRKGRVDLAKEVQKRMQIRVTVKDVTGNYDSFTVPADLKLGKDGQGAQYWSETE